MSCSAAVIVRGGVGRALRVHTALMHAGISSRVMGGVAVRARSRSAHTGSRSVAQWCVQG